MSSERSLSDFYLVLKAQIDGKDGYLLEAYEAMPAGSEPPLASAALPSLDYGRLAGVFNGIFANDPLAPQQMGDYLAAWLFVEQPAAAPFPLASSPALPYNPVGACFQERLADLRRKQQPLLTICLDRRLLVDRYEFRRGFVPLECLERNSLWPLRVVRGVVGSSAISPPLADPSMPLEVADKLRILLVYANPDKDKVPPDSPYPHLEELHQHFEVLCRTLDPLLHAGEVFIEVLRNPTPEGVRGALIRFNPHLLVFAGHGYGSSGDEGGLVCVREGAPEPWPFLELLKAVKEVREPALRLGVFIACQSFVAAPGLLAAGVPAVVAMQPLAKEDFPERVMPVFAEPFFGTLAHLGPVGAAHSAACRTLEASVLPYAALMPTLWLATAWDKLFANPEERLRAIYLDALLGKPEVALLPFPGVEGGVPLGKLYVDQTVVKKKEEEEKEKERPLVPSPEATAAEGTMKATVMQEVVNRVEVDLLKALKEHHWVLVEAPAWMGKSTLCQWVAQNCDARTGWLPIWINFRDFAQSGKSIQLYMEKDYAIWLGLKGRRIKVKLSDGSRRPLSVGSWLFNQWQAGQALLILDGADEEFDKKRRENALSSLLAARHRANRSFVLLTSRPLRDGWVLGFEKLELREFERQRIESLVRQCGEVLDEYGEGRTIP